MNNQKPTSLILTFIGYIDYGHPIHYNTSNYSVSKKNPACFAIYCSFSFVIKIVTLKLIARQLCAHFFKILPVYNFNFVIEICFVIKRKIVLIL